MGFVLLNLSFERRLRFGCWCKPVRFTSFGVTALVSFATCTILSRQPWVPKRRRRARCGLGVCPAPQA